MESPGLAIPVKEVAVWGFAPTTQIEVLWVYLLTLKVCTQKWPSHE
ncbi:hypothetical protein GZOEXZXM_CDS0216 [Salmonella phage SeKF_64]|uniref:Uncharacterized protein n=1 Tax=Salmonella phage PMBT18 TaxID=3229742 RepID=A0AB39C1Z5_9CAUD|nr:hypothetical protein SeF6a_218 [Salmonella phage SeF6a]